MKFEDKNILNLDGFFQRFIKIQKAKVYVKTPSDAARKEIKTNFRPT